MKALPKCAISDDFDHRDRGSDRMDRGPDRDRGYSDRLVSVIFFVLGKQMDF